MTDSDKREPGRPRDEEWTAAEKEALAALAGGVAPPAGLEESVVRALRRRGLLEGRPPRGFTSLAARASWGLLAAAGLMAAGFALGRVTAGKPSDRPAGPMATTAAQRYVLLLLDEAPEPPATEEARRVAEYTEWARKLATEGRLASGAKLAPEETVLGPPRSLRPSPAGALGGFFMIITRDLAEAVAIAGSCPHLRYGGRIILRRVE